MQRKSGQSNPGSELTQSTPRLVRLSRAGILLLVLSAALILGGLWGGNEIYGRAELSARRAELLASEGTSTDARIVRVQQRRGEGDRGTSAVHYRYTVGDRELAGETKVRRVDRDRYSVGSQVSVWYLPSQPATSWMHGYEPERQAVWPAFVVPAALVVPALFVAALIRRQSQLLGYGRPALAVVTKVEKKRHDNGTYWRVHYEWTLLSGGKRKGRYRHDRKEPPPVGATVPIVYDRDQPSRHSKYPLSLVRIG